MASDYTHTTALHLKSSSDDAIFIEGFRRAGFHVKSVNLLADAIAALEGKITTTPITIAVAPAQHGGIALLELLAELDILTRVKVILIDHECDARTAIKALRLGATDYFTSDMSSQAVQMRVQTLVTNHVPEANTIINPIDDAVMFDGLALANLPAPLPDNISVNSNLRAIRKGDMWISLSPIEWRLFEELLRHRGRVVQFAELVRRGLNRDQVTPSETSLLRLHMSRLRGKLMAHFDRDLNIITLRGRGYMMA